MDELAPAKAKGSRGIFKLIILIVVVVGLLLAAKFLPVKDYIMSALEWAQGLGSWGPIFVGVLYVLACVLMVPGSIITIAAGFLFGLFWGTITVSIASTLGACLAFIVGRTLARGPVEQKVTHRPKFAAIDKAVGEQGFKIVLLTRLSPIFPFNLLNYAYGLTKVGFWQYALASWIGMLPGTVLFVYMGTAGRSLTDIAAGEGQSNWATRIFLLVGLLVAIVVVFFVTRVARKALADAMGDSKSAGAQ